MSSENKKILMFASFGNMAMPPGGGGQVSARRLRDVLSGLGYDVECFSRYIRHKYLGFLTDPLRFLARAAGTRHNPDSVALIVGYGGKLLPYYLSFVRASRLCGWKTVLYIKGSFSEASFDGYSKNVRRRFAKSLKNCDCVMTEGRSGAEMISSRFGYENVVWMPNYVETRYMPQELVQKPEGVFNLVYLGRICPEKNVLSVVSAFNILSGHLDGLTLKIVGSGPSDYERRVDEAIGSSPCRNSITRISRVDHAEVFDIFKECHFLFLPSTELQEGHSNSLNEAMAYGVVPVVSDNNYLPDIVGDSSLVVKGTSPENYASAIEDIITKGEFGDKSRFVYERVRSIFSQQTIETSLKKVIEQ